MSKGNYLGILDWGIGGLGLYNAIKAHSPQCPTLYFSDAGAKPYGKLAHDEMQSRLIEVLNFMHDNGAEHVAIACNAASCALPVQVKPQYTGVIEHGITAVLETNASVVGVIGGQRTITSNCYFEALSKNNLQVLQQIAQPLSNLIEQGDLNSTHIKNTAREILAPLQTCDQLLLGCTHYPAISPIIQELLGQNITLIDPVATMADWIKINWRFAPNPNQQDVFLTTGNIEAMKSAAQKVFNVTIENVRQANL